MTVKLLLLPMILAASPESELAQRGRTIEMDDGSVRCVAISFDGRIVAGCGNRFVQLFDLKSGERLHRLEGHVRAVSSLAFSPDGKLLASASQDATIRLWGVGSGESLRVLRNETRPRNPHPPRNVVFSPDGKTLVASYLMHSDRTQIVVYDVERGKWRYDARQPRPESPLHLAISPDGKMLAVAKDRGNITLMDVVESGVRDRFIPPRVILPDGLDSTRYPLKHAGERPVSHVDFSRDSKSLLSCGGDNTIRIWDTKTARSLAVIKGPSETQLVRAAFSRDETRIISVTRNEIIQVWDAGSGRLLASDRGPDRNVRALALSPDGRVLATGGGEGVIKLWQITSDPGKTDE